MTPKGRGGMYQGCIFRQFGHTGGGRKNKDEFRKFRKDKLKKRVYPPYFEAFEVKRTLILGIFNENNA